MSAQTGGSRKTWLFDTNDFELIGPIRDALVHYDQYFNEEYDTNTLAIVMDHVLDDLPIEQAECVKLVYLEGRSYREAGRTLGIDHKTVKSRADKGVEAMRARLVDSVWIAEMLRGYIPQDELSTQPNTKATSRVVDVLHGLRDGAK